MANEYATLTQLKALRRITGTADDTDLQDVLTAASRRIDQRCGRRFYLDDSATARTYWPVGSSLADGTLLVDDIGSATGLVIEYGPGSTWTAVSSDFYWLSPDNALTRGVPITGIRMAGYLSGYVRVTARWGWPTPPPEVQRATLILANKLYLRKDSPEGLIRSEGVRVSRLDPDVEALIEPYILPGLA